MKKQFKAILTGTLLAVAAMPAGAVPAKRGVIAVEQPDGTAIQAQIIGDERDHQYFTPDGYLLVDDGGFFYYGNADENGVPVSSGIRAAAVRDQAAQAYLSGIDRTLMRQRLQARLGRSADAVGRRRVNGLFPETRFPAMGEQKAIVILVEYKDVKMQTEDAQDYFSRMLNEDGFSDYGGTGCAREYFILNSGGNFVPQFDVFGPITLSQNRNYYGGNNWSGDDKNPDQMVVEACRQLDGEVDFSEYDRDNDGYVDNVFVFYAGRGEASGGGSDTVWPHSWTLASAGVSISDRTFDGVVVDRYGCTNEWEGSRPDGVGTFIHEFSHVIGLPDLYATSYTSSFTPGSWSALDYGPYNNNGCTPPNYGAFERCALGWMDPVRIEGPMTATLPEISENVAGIIYNDSNPDEYFLLENRQKNGWDTYIPGHGMLIWHVDYDAMVWGYNTVNNTASHQYVDIEEADGTQSEYTRDGDSFPGSDNVTSFTDTTRPGMKTWGGAGFDLPLTEITENNGVITFMVSGGASNPATPVVEVTDQTPESLTITWNYENNPDLIATVSKTAETAGSDGVGTTVVLSAVNCGRTGAYTFEGLEPETDYSIEVYFRNGLQVSETAVTTGFTGRPGLDRLTVTLLEPENISDGKFTARWEQLPEATDYLLTVYEKVFGAPFVDVCGFDGYDSDNTLPQGWSASTPSTYANTSYSGAAIPALRMGRNGDNVSSPLFDDDIRGISFWHRGNGTADEDAIVVQLLDAELNVWDTLTQVTVVRDAGGELTVIDDIPAGYSSVRLTFKRSGTRGALAIDDVEIRHGATYTDELLPSYDAIHTGNTDSYDVTGLKPETKYTYIVNGTDGTLVSRKPSPMDVQTKKQSGIADTAAGEVSVIAGTGSVTVNGIPTGTTIIITDIAGRTVAQTVSDGGGVMLRVPAQGMYIVHAGRTVVKTVVR